MRVRSDTELIDLIPGQRADITLDVVNTGDVIDGVTARVVGLPEQHVSSQPTVLPLFPDSAGQLTLTLGLPASFPAGRHPMTVEVHSRQIGIGPEYVDVDLVVPRAPAMSLSARPQTIRAHRGARFVLTVANRGNIALDVALSGTDTEKAVAITMAPSRLTVAAGGAKDVIVSARGPRMMLGSDLDRPLTITGSARTGDPVSLLLAPDPMRPIELPGPEPVEDLEPQAGEAGEPPIVAVTTLTLRQRPWLSRGLLTAFILLAIIALWAGVFVFGIGKVFAGDPLTKEAPPSFFAAAASAAPTSGNVGASAVPGASVSAGASGPGAGATGGASGASVGAARAGATAGAGTPAAVPGAVQAAPPADSIPKSGVMPAGLGGTLAGTVTAASDGLPVGRILVEAKRIRADGTTITASSAATQLDGSYELAGLFPGNYFLEFSATGFTTTYLPAQPEKAGAGVSVTSGGVTANINAVITGLPGEIRGSIDPGDTTSKVIASISVVPQAGSQQGHTIQTITTDADGSYKIQKLPAPGEYQLNFRATGYQPTSAEVAVSGGTTRYQPAILLESGLGQISGTVTDGSAPLGGITVTTTVDGSAVTTGTPTNGQVGDFVLGQLPTPATYVITFSGPGYGQVTVVVDLGPGSSQPNMKVALAKGTGAVTGRLVDAVGNGLGGATVTVGGAADPPTTTTLTNGNVGFFSLDGLVSPGSYTLTFTLPGYADATVPVVLSGTAAIKPLTVTMAGSLGSITGRVTIAGQPVEGAAVVATDGKRSWPVTSTAAAGVVPDGGYVISQLPAGVYSVTVTAPNGDSAAMLVTVAAGFTAVAEFPLTAPAAGG